MATVKRIKTESGIWIVVFYLLICFLVFLIVETPDWFFKIVFGILTVLFIFLLISWMKLLIKCRDFEIRKNIVDRLTKKIEKAKEIKPKKRK